MGVGKCAYQAVDSKDNRCQQTEIALSKLNNIKQRLALLL